jgi:hypothetical protein
LFSDAHGSHVPVGPPVQHPFGHEAASHTHCPVVLLHSSPVLQPPQEAPLEPQEPLFSLDRASHALPLQQPAHVPPPQEQAPLTQAPLAHGPQRLPPVPHEFTFCPVYASHAPAAVQQPFGHDAALQMH